MTDPAADIPLMDSDAEALEDEARRRFHQHLVDRASAARFRFGLYIDAEAIVRMLGDASVVRYPVSLHYDARPLMPGEFAHAQPIGFHPSDGFALFVHPCFRDQPENLPLLIAYHLPSINYGDAAGPAEAELFGAALLGLEVDQYYQALCELADSIPPAAG